MFRVVPPTATTSVEAAGYSTPLPLSPEEAVKVTPLTAKWVSLLASLENSDPPKLMETTLAPFWTATSTAWSKFVKLFEGASTRMIFACGAIACDHSTSSEISSDQPELVRGFDPDAKILRKHPLLVVQVGRLNCDSKTARSDSMLGSSKASTIPMIWPAPWFVIWSNPYA